MMNRVKESFDPELIKIREKKFKALLKDTGKKTTLPNTPVVLNDLNFIEFVKNYPFVFVDC